MSDNIQSKGTPRLMRNIFGVIMILVYIGMGVLFLQLFGFGGDWAWTRWLIGGLLVAYGIWRAYRQFAGIDYPDDNQ